MLRLVTQATTEPVSIDIVKTRLRLDDDLDAVLPGMISAARELVERQTGYALADAEYEWTPQPDADGNARTSPLPILPATVTSDEGATPITFKTVPGPAPWALVSAVLLLIGDQIANTEAHVEKPLTVSPAVADMIFPFRDVLP
jgi:hypothetical protein